MKVRSVPYLSGLLVLCSLCFRIGVAQAGDVPLVFLHVTVINPGTSSVEPDRAVTINGNRIPPFPTPGISSPHFTPGLSTGQANF
jgi:hypothetical protein